MPQHLATAALLAPGLLTLAASIAGTRRGPKPALALSAVRAASLAALVVALAAAGAIDNPAAREVSERMRLADQ